jgi:signal peptidase II
MTTEPTVPVSPSRAAESRSAFSPKRPQFLVFSIVAGIVLLLDIGTKIWAHASLAERGSRGGGLELIADHLNLVLAYNQGGAFGFLHDAPELVRRPFFIVVSLVAIAFIVSLYRKVSPHQWALIWGLPLVLGGALGNFVDRITRVGVVDFIDFRADFLLSMNQLIAKVFPGWTVTDHWPTFNVADIAICVGVGLMALDVLFTRKPKDEAPTPTNLSPSGSEPSV